jgi:dihydrofolate reductase / thymidylate synthase
MHFKVIVACDLKNGIGKNNDIPWKLTKELKYFKKITTHTTTPLLKNVVIMGRKTWDSIPQKFKPLQDRINIVITRTPDQFKDEEINNNDLFFCSSLANAKTLVMNIMHSDKDNTFIIGGESIYRDALQNHSCSKIYYTEVCEKYECDTFFPILNEEFKLQSVSKFIQDNETYYRNLVFVNTSLTKTHSEIELWENKEEKTYLEVMNKIITLGEIKLDRTEVGIYSIFGETFKYDLTDTFPVLTTRRQFLRGIFEELKFYLSGKTDNKLLTDKNVNIWNANTTREFLDKRGLSHYPEHDMGETYGFNFRHYGAEYKTCQENYEGQGFDQVNYVLDLIKNNPSSRRIIIDIWNCSTLDKASLPPCLCKYQFNVNIEKKQLNLMIYLRSSDFFLANNWNVCTGAFFVHMICNLKDIDLTPGILTVVTGDTHIYSNHMKQVKQNLERHPKPFPKLVITEKKDKLEDFEYSDMKIIGYKPDKNIPAPMAV